MKRTICLILSVLFLIAFTSCTAEKTAEPTVTPAETPIATPTPTPMPTPVPVSFKDYQHYEVENGTPKDKFNITYFFGPNNKEMTEDVVKLIADCGFTSVPIDLSWDQGVDLQCTADAVKLLAEYGLIAVNITMPCWSIRCPIEDFDEVGFENAAKAMIDAVKDFDNVKSFHLCDEPAEEWFPSLAKANEILRRLAPGKDSFINLGPSWGHLTVREHEEYLDRYIELVKPSYLSYDNYCLKKPVEYDEGPNGFFTNLALIRKAGLEHNLSYENIVLLSEHYSYPNLTRTQIAWEVSNSLLYGVKGISYFTFSLSKDLIENEGYNNACINYKGEIYPHYYDVQAVNRWALPLGTELYNKTSMAIFHTASKNQELLCEDYTGYGKLGTVTPISGEFAIGFFDDDSFMITNKNFDSDKIQDILILNDLTPDTKLEYFDTVSATWRPASENENITISNTEDHCYFLNIDQGMFMYLRVAD